MAEEGGPTGPCPGHHNLDTRYKQAPVLVVSEFCPSLFPKSWIRPCLTCICWPDGGRWRGRKQGYDVTYTCSTCKPRVTKNGNEVEASSFTRQAGMLPVPDITVFRWKRRRERRGQRRFKQKSVVFIGQTLKMVLWYCFDQKWSKCKSGQGKSNYSLRY